MKQFHKQFLSSLLAIALAVPAIPSGISNTITASAETNWKFDLGGGGTASGYTGVSAATAYSKELGYGFANTSGVTDVSASGKDALSDAVRFTSTDVNNTFNVDLPNGLYQVTVTTGDTTRTSIRAEGMLQLINLTGSNAVETFQLPVIDGQLNIMATEGRAGTYFSISSVEITQLNDTAQTNPTIWLCGDSTVANYYNTSDNLQHGWGQYLKNYLPSAFANYEVRNMAASGQYAKGFVDAGQFDAIETYGKAGDYYIISIGINDTNYSNAEEY
ncbi:MAG: GDSL family lipase, partial [Oscillospiraceae bacterium]|nr:GDSL family lipase [Oscillospiraceae bacterium]